MSAVEFLGSDDPVPTPAPRPRRAVPRPAPRVVTVLAINSWLAAAVLLVIAPFRSVFLVSGPRLRGHKVGALDGWGRDRLHVLEPTHTSPGGRFGIVLLVCASLLLAACVLRARTSRSRTPHVIAASLLTIGGPFLLAGTVAAMGLVAGGYRRQLAPFQSSVSWGGCLWLSSLACVLAGAGSTLHLWIPGQDTSPVVDTDQ